MAVCKPDRFGHSSTVEGVGAESSLAGRVGSPAFAEPSASLHTENGVRCVAVERCRLVYRVSARAVGSVCSVMRTSRVQASWRGV